jgi:hypothetical protein
VYLGGGRRATVFQGDPGAAALRGELRNVTAHQAQILVTYGDGKQVRLFAHGGYDAIKLYRQLGEPAWLAAYLERLGYKPEQHGGIASTQVVLL